MVFKSYFSYSRNDIIRHTVPYGNNEVSKVVFPYGVSTVMLNKFEFVTSSSNEVIL